MGKTVLWFNTRGDAVIPVLCRACAVLPLCEASFGRSIFSYTVPTKLNFQGSRAFCYRLAVGCNAHHERLAELTHSWFCH